MIMSIKIVLSLIVSKQTLYLPWNPTKCKKKKIIGIIIFLSRSDRSNPIFTVHCYRPYSFMVPCKWYTHHLVKASNIIFDNKLRKNHRSIAIYFLFQYHSYQSNSNTSQLHNISVSDGIKSSDPSVHNCYQRTHDNGIIQIHINDNSQGCT